MPNISVKVPKEFSDILNLRDREEIQKESRILIAIELYREGRISAGKAAEMAGLSFNEFLDELKKRNMKLFTMLNVDKTEREVDQAEKYLQ